MKQPDVPKKGNNGRLLKIVFGLAFLAGLGVALYSNNALLQQGYTLSTFAVILPYVLGAGSFFCFVLVIGGRKKPKATTIVTARETEAEDSPSLEPEGEYLTIVRPCNKEGCPSHFHFTGSGKCGSNGVRPDYCQLDEKAFAKLFAK